MRTTFQTVAIACLLSWPVAGQQWTPAQQEVIDLTRTCWEAWAAENTAAVLRDCPDHPEAAHWFTSEDVPAVGWSAKNVQNWMAGFFPRTQPVYWEIRPLIVKIFGDTALYHFWALWTEEDASGQLNTWTRKQLDVWQRVNGRWQFIGGTATQTAN